MGGVSSVKGIILDFKNDDKNGLILGEDGNRYSFFYDTDWQNKITELKINSEVDFIVKDNKATEIYCLNNKNNDDISLNKNIYSVLEVVRSSRTCVSNINNQN